MSMAGAKTYAYDIEATNSDGVTIYYVWTNNNTELAVSHRGDNFIYSYSGNVVIPDSVTYDGVTYSVTAIGNEAFRSCQNLSSVTIPNSITSIGKSAFDSCTGLTSITIPCNVKSIGTYAFYKCWRLPSMTIPNSVTSIGEYAFSDCTSLTSVSIPSSLTSIVGGAFHNCSSLTSIEIPNSVSIIDASAFYGCSSLASVTIPNSVTSIEACAFKNCNSLTSIEIPNSVVSIGSGAFEDCSGLTSVTIPNSITSIVGFRGCSGLTSVTIPNSVTSIGNLAFYGCSGLTSVIIPNSVTSISTNAFNGCSGLISVTIGRGINDIGYRAFAYCPEITDVLCYAENVPSTYSNAFQDSNIEKATLHVPTASIDAYKSTAPWSSFKTFEELDDTLPDPLVQEQCATPTITYVDGKLVFACETEGVSFVSQIKHPEVKDGNEGEVQLKAPTTTITVYATKAGYDNSDVATATIRWRNGRPVFEGFSSVTLEPAEDAGDVNGDGTVGIGDIVSITNIMAGIEE